MINIIQTRPGNPDFYLFKNIPKEIYAPDLIHFNPQETIDEEFLHSCYMVVQDDKVCARAAVYSNPYLRYENKATFCIGNYESVNNANISSALLSYIFKEIKQSGADFIIGPMDGSTWNQYRFSLHHNDPNFFLEPYQHLYYNEQFAQAGFRVIANYFSSIDTRLHYDDPYVLNLEMQFEKAGVTFRNIDLTHYEQELEKLYALTAVAFKNNFLYTPVSKEKFIKKYAQTRQFIDPDFVILAEDEKQNLLGYFFCVNDLLSTTHKSLIVKTLARHPDQKWKGLGHVIGNRIYRQAIQKQYTSIVHAFVREQGTSTALSKSFSGAVYKNYALYGKEI